MQVYNFVVNALLYFEKNVPTEFFLELTLSTNFTKPKTQGAKRIESQCVPIFYGKSYEHRRVVGQLYKDYPYAKQHGFRIEAITSHQKTDRQLESRDTQCHNINDWKI